MISRSFGVLFLLLTYILSSLQVSVQAKTPVTTLDQIQFMTDEIVDKELDVLRLNTRFRIATNHQTKSRTFRQFLYNLLASGVSLGSTTTIMAHRWDDSTPNRNVLEGGAIGLVTGQGIIDGGIAIEYAIDKIKERAARKRGFGEKAVRKDIQKFKFELDKLIAERKTFLATSSSLSDEQKAIFKGETEVIDDIRDLSLVEFARFYSDQHKRRTSRNVSYINGLIATGAGGYGGSLMGLLAVTEGKPSLSIPAGIGFITSSLTVMVSPITNRFFSKWSKRKTSKEIREALGELSVETVDDLNRDLNQLSMIVNATKIPNRPNDISSRLAVYAAELEMLTHQINREFDKDVRAKILFRDRLLSNNVIASTKLTWGTMLIYAGSKFDRRPRDFNRTVAQAATVYTVGQGAWVLDTLFSGKRPKALKFPIGGQIRLPVEKLEKRINRLIEIQHLVRVSQDEEEIEEE